MNINENKKYGQDYLTLFCFRISDGFGNMDTRLNQMYKITVQIEIIFFNPECSDSEDEQYRKKNKKQKTIKSQFVNIMQDLKIKTSIYTACLYRY